MDSFVLYEEQLLQENEIFDKILEKKDKIIEKLKKLIHSTPEKIKSMEKKLIDRGVDVQKIKKDAKSAAAGLKLKNGKYIGVKEKLNKFASDFLTSKKYFVDGVEPSDIDGADIVTGVLLSLALLATIYYLNTMIGGLLIAKLGETLGRALMCIICGPIIEETGKLISVKTGTTTPFFVIFNASEYFRYVKDAIGGGMALTTALIWRLLPVLMHWVCTIIHVDAHKHNDSTTGWFQAVGLHALWNTFANLKFF